MEYQQLLQADGWSRPETDHLFDLCRRYDLRFFIVSDRWDRNRFPATKSVEELKERYYDVCNILNKARHAVASASSTPAGPEPKVIAYDADNEKRRKEQLKRLFERTSEQVEEEQNLIAELRKIEARKKDRERKTQDLQKLITAADSGGGAASNSAAGGSADGPFGARGTPSDKKQQVRKKANFTTPKAKLLELTVIVHIRSSA